MNLYKLRIKGKKVFALHEGSISFDMAKSTATTKDGMVYHDCTLVEFMCELNEPKKIEVAYIDEAPSAPKETQLSLFGE